jgi:hypothetical protein
MQARRRSKTWLVLVMSWLPLLWSVAAVAGPASELTAIENTLRDYLQGGSDGDLAKLRGAIHARARLQFVRDGKYTEWSLNKYLNACKPNHRSNLRTRILAIDFAGTAATAKLELEFGRHKLINYMSLLKIDDRWWIVNKIFYRSDD